MTKIKVDFEDKDYTLEIDGKEYPIAKRTGEIEEKIIEHDKKTDKKSEYESNVELLNILLGFDAVKEIFPDGERENLDKIAKVTYYAVKYFNKDKVDLDKKHLEEMSNPIKEILKQINDIIEKFPENNA